MKMLVVNTNNGNCYTINIDSIISVEYIKEFNRIDIYMKDNKDISIQNLNKKLVFKVTTFFTGSSEDDMREQTDYFNNIFELYVAMTLFCCIPSTKTFQFVIGTADAKEFKNK